VLIDARGKYFSVGADLKTMIGGRDELPRFVKNATAGLHVALSRFARMDAPVVVAVHGLAVGGAVALTAAADFALAGASASFYAAYMGIGLIPDAGGTTFLPERVGVRRAVSFYMRNETWTADEALRHGLLTEVVDDGSLGRAAVALATELARGPTRAYGALKNLLLSTSTQPPEAQLEAEARAMAACARTDDCWNAVQAVLGKQTPHFAGK
jgi:2-(1,2-epoxy-1,2-dihydrophenyl)acetyl-CoA isomerase